jgi:hypothetical protein|nr:MAG TPA: hypothetical protein [Caudoviricetes sp.]DAZ77197.1 MAG TPA: hypothetical protein [Caudoviricetes sp.]
MEKISLQEMVGGALQEQFEKSFLRVVENLSDPNTPFKDCRKICIELKFTQNEARDDVSCAIKVSEKLAAQAPMQTAFVIGKDLKTGQMFAEEYGRHKHLPGQMQIESEPEIPCNPETGEIIEPVPTTVIDMRKAMKA